MARPRAITFDRFDAGIDLRKGHTVSDANRMRELLNCDVTNGLAIRKRPGLRKIKDVPTDSVGLFALDGEVKTVTKDSLGADKQPVALFSSMVVSGYLYVVVGFADKSVGHYWFDDADNKVITDGLCPQSQQVITLQGKVFAAAPDGASVRFSATNNPRDWSTADDAGFLPISHHGGGRVTALAVYRGMLAVFTDVNVQIWRVDPDPAQHSLVDVSHGIGTEYPFSITSVSGDVLFFGHGGVRSLSQQSTTGNLSDLDIGSPVDSISERVIKDHANNHPVLGHYSQALGKFILACGNEALVYSFSKSSKVAAWSRWTLPASIQDLVDLAGVTYIRIDDVLYTLDPYMTTDNGQAFECVAEMGFMALKAQGSLKRLLGMDIVTDGQVQFSLGFDERNPEQEFLIGTLSDDTRPTGTIPVELSGTAFAPRFRSQSDQAFQVNLLTFYYEVMGVR